MIGVVAHTKDSELVREFFELFKTPWEFYRTDGQYEVALVARENVSPHNVTATKLVVVYASQATSFDAEENTEITSHRSGGMLFYKGSPLPIYGKRVTLRQDGISLLTEQDSKQSAGHVQKSGHPIIARIGYDLFEEIRALLTEGQTIDNAGIPTLEIHIALLRDLIVESGTRLVEVPPVPDGYTFIACLTHDVDHPSVRLHKWDHTMFGFMYRAVIGSILGVLKGRLPIRHLLTNWAAVAKLPFIHLGLAKDFWDDFDRYLDIEKGLDSTFFVLPFKGKPGRTESGLAPRIRASSYGAADIAARLQILISSRREIGLHGIDAWIDAATGGQEMEQVSRITGTKNIGVRMHWLYLNQSSPVVLESAGFTYDSTVGYNETIGYRAGTTQVYKPLQAHHLLELPLHVMDTALFYAGYLNLSFDDAGAQVQNIMNNAIRFGGAVTFNWHDRSVAPERQWGEFYTHLIGELKVKGAWSTNAGCAVAWFQQRRSVRFQRVEQSIEARLPISQPNPDKRVPALKVRVYNPEGISPDSSEAYVEAVLAVSKRIRLPVHGSVVFQ